MTTEKTITEETPFQLDPQLASAFAKASEIEKNFKSASSGIEAVRERAAFCRSYWNEGGPEMASVERCTVPGPTRHVSLVLYRPLESAEPLPVLVFLHGGGFKLGNECANDRQMREIAASWGGLVISADYLHAPENVFPSAVDEFACVLHWLHDSGHIWGIDTERIAFGGTSAGASVAFGAAVALGQVPWLQAAVGVVGAFSFDIGSTSMRKYGGGELFPALQVIQPMLDAYVTDPCLRDDPRVNLTKADASTFPPTLLAAAEFDVFMDASVEMADRLRDAGRLVELKIYPGMAHLFFGFSREVECSARCVQDIAHFLAERMPPGPT